MSDADVDALFGSSDEDEAPQQQAKQQGDSEERAVAVDELRQPGGGSEVEEDARRPSPAGQASQEQPAAERRFADDEEDPGDYTEPTRAGEEEETEPEEELGPPLELQAPLVDGPDPSRLHLVRASNILGVQTKPFSPETHEYEDEEYEDPATGQVRVRLANCIRWRHVQRPNGSTGRESNARFVRWSDGSLQLLVGDEVLDVTTTDISGDHHFMYVRHRGFVRAQAQLAMRMTFRPSSLKSAAHKRLTAVMDKRHGIKGARVQATTTVVDPKKEKEAREKAEEARIRDREGLAKRQEKEMRKYTHTPAARSTAGGLSAAYLEAPDEEGEEEEEDEGLTASEAARRALARPRHDARAEAEAERRLATAKRGAPLSSGGPAKRQRAAYDVDEDDDGEMHDFIVDDEDDDEEEAVGARKPAAARRRFALSDDEEE